MPNNILFCFLVYVDLICIKHNSVVLYSRICILREIGIIDSRLEATGLGNLLRNPLSSLLLLEKTLPIHDKDALFLC